MQITLSRSDGLHVLTRARLKQLIENESLRLFADGIIPQALTATDMGPIATWRVAEALHHQEVPQIKAFLTVLLALDVEVNAVVEDEKRVWPLPGYLSYHAQLPLERYPLNTLRLPPLNPDGHYRFDLFTAADEVHYLAVRMDIHPKLKVAGHVRLAISGSRRPPQRILAAEHRLDRQELKEEIIQAAVTAGSQALSASLSEPEQAKLIELLRGLYHE